MCDHGRLLTQPGLLVVLSYAGAAVREQPVHLCTGTRHPILMALHGEMEKCHFAGCHTGMAQLLIVLHNPANQENPIQLLYSHWSRPAI